MKGSGGASKVMRQFLCSILVCNLLPLGWKCHYLKEHPYHWIGIKVSVVAVSDSTGLLSISTVTERARHPTLVRLAARRNKNRKEPVRFGSVGFGSGLFEN